MWATRGGYVDVAVETRWTPGVPPAVSAATSARLVDDPAGEQDRTAAGAIHRDVHRCGQKNFGGCAGPCGLQPPPRLSAGPLQAGARERTHGNHRVRLPAGVDRSLASAPGRPDTRSGEPEAEYRTCAAALRLPPHGARPAGRFPGRAPEHAEGRWLAETRCELEASVSGWFGRSGPCGTSWALAFGAGGRHEPLQVRFASLRARRVVPVVSDHYGIWVAEVAGAFRAATILSSQAMSTFRLHYAS